MASAPSIRKGEDYGGILSRGGPAEWRLSFQHFVTIQHQGFLIHPKIEKEILQRKDPKIADLATGNGIWVLDAAEKYPNAEILGSDITDKQFPAPALRSPNTRFEVQNMFDEVPVRHRGAFDMVHLRLTVAWLYGQDRDLLVRNALSMLKPGGFIQWSEISNPPTLLYEPDGEVHPEVPERLLRVYKTTNLMPTFEWLSQLGDILPSHYGLIEVEVQNPRPTGVILLYYNHLLEWTLRECYEVMMKAGVSNAGNDYALSLDEQDRDYRAGKHFAYNWQTVVARRPF